MTDTLADLLADAAPLSPPAEFEGLCADFGIELAPEEIERLGLLLSMVLRANEAMNLTAITDPAEAWVRHIFDSLTPIALLAELEEGAAVIDVGSGAGFPGLPLAIALPHLQFVLLDATGKKCEFMRAAIARLGLQNASVVQGRAESLGQDRGTRTGTGRAGGHRERYAAVVSRAVGRLATLVELTAPLCAPGGFVVLTKGAKVDEELTEAGFAMREVCLVHAQTLATPTGRLVVLEKRSATPRTYPRRDGEPKSRPLGVARDRR